MITIEHDAHETRAEGTAKGDGTAPHLKAAGFRWAPSVGAWTLNRTWHYSTRTAKARAAVAMLNAAGHAAELVEAEAAPAVTSAADVAAREAENAERAEARADRFAARAERLGAASDEAWNGARDLGSRIPFGQPVLVGHHSEGRHRRDLARIDAGYRKGIELHDAAKDAARRAHSAETSQRHRESLPTTLRRIDRLEAERRDIGRRIDGTSAVSSKPAAGEWLERLTVMATELDAELTYWRQHVAKLQEAGARVFTRADFQPGDWTRVRGGGWCEVVKANPKNLSLQGRHMVRPLPYPYGDVTDMRTAAQVAELAARTEAEQATA